MLVQVVRPIGSLPFHRIHAELVHGIGLIVAGHEDDLFILFAYLDRLGSVEQFGGNEHSLSS